MSQRRHKLIALLNKPQTHNKKMNRCIYEKNIGTAN